MNFPPFYQTIEKIKLYDPLSDLLGSSQNGIIEFSFEDIVKVMGHGCPTVGGAYLMTLKGIKSLFPNELATRGMVEAHFNKSKNDGTTGVMASVVSAIVGASDEGGFKGLAGNFHRNNLLRFNSSFDGRIKLIRTDNHKSVVLDYFPEIVPPHILMSELLGKILNHKASTDDKREFANHWNNRLKKIMIDEFDNPKLISIRE